jgi:hypothetical protein
VRDESPAKEKQDKQSAKTIKIKNLIFLKKKIICPPKGKIKQKRSLHKINITLIIDKVVYGIQLRLNYTKTPLILK